MIEKLVRQGYEEVTINDYDSMVANFRTHLNTFNKKKLDGQPLSDTEFNRLFTQIDGKSIFESAKILRNKQILQRDDGTEVYIERTQEGEAIAK
ncbi:hypothetical protein MM221_20625 [Salipaludibacillus sp. LMS25]|jgi:type I restriction enzyme R subunit|uniref:hypothetical protein n=1 Tax=Salipaludibacillus sp. LMS25 TaxID=2924031 RepID=UPI0020D1AAE2|nr:hypothetical protein [Salipaludibacillus sp. LMS25]UTR14911.1 hypothetical protein MM221_20625 [Salipaludibacillus sp. LMS25]